MTSSDAQSKRKRYDLISNQASDQRVEYWKDFKVYLNSEGSRLAECKYCPKTFSIDPSINGTKNVRDHWVLCQNNPADEKKRKQTKLILEQVDGKLGEGKLSNWVLNVDELREALCYMVIIDELPFCFVEKPGFVHMMSVACPEFALPSRMTVARGCFQLYLKEKEKLKEFLKVSCQRVCVTIDSWTSNRRINYMCLTAHFIDEDWNLQKRILNFCPITNYKGEAIAKVIEICLEDWGLAKKLLTVTVDNASSNDVACGHLVKMMQNKGCIISNGKYLHMRCVAHIVNLIVWDSLKMKDSLQAVERIRAAVKFMRNLPGRTNHFKESAAMLNIKSKFLLALDVPTRWDSTYTMLMSALKCEQIFRGFELDKKQELLEPNNVGPPNKSDWDLVRRLVVFLEMFFVLTNNVSGSLSVTCNGALFDIGTVLGTLKYLEGTCDPELGEMARNMREKFNKYWGSLEKFNMFIYVAVILDPMMKFVGLQLTLHEMYGELDGDILLEEIQQVVYDLFDEYKSLYCPIVAPIGASVENVSNETHTRTMRTNIKAKVRQLKSSSGAKGKYMSTRSELEMCLNEDTNEEDIEILNWWKLNSLRFPVLSRMARDILAMPVSTIASEAAFSAGGRTLDQFKSSLTPKVMQGLICGQDWLRAALKNRTKVVNVEEDLEELMDLENDLQRGRAYEFTLYV